MPQLQNITVSYSRKVQLEQFEPIEHSVELDVDVDSDDDPDEVYDRFVERAEGMVERAIVDRVSSNLTDGNDSNDSE